MEETKPVPPGACGRGRELTFFMMPEPTLDERSFAAESSCFHQARAGADLAAYAAAPFAAPAEAAFFEAPDATAAFAASFAAFAAAFASSFNAFFVYGLPVCLLYTSDAADE